MDFDWDEANEEHIARHGVEPGETEEVLEDPRRMNRGVAGWGLEARRVAFGRTETGRMLCVVFTLRGARYRVVTARPATPAETRAYERNWRR